MHAQFFPKWFPKSLPKSLHPDANQDPVIKTTKHPLSSFSLLHYVNRLCLLIMLVGLGVILSPHSAYAACSNPAGEEGEQVFNSTYRNMQFCNGTDWIAMGYVRGPGIACAAPWGGTIDSGAEVIAFENATVPFGNVCNGETRICDEGSLSGSFTNQTCSVSAADSTPDPFNFSNQTNVARNSLITSNTVTISGLTVSSPVSISGQGSPEFRIDGGSWTTSGIITNGQTLQLRLTSSSSYYTTFSATVDVGGTTDNWTVRTLSNDPCDGSPSIGTVCLDSSVYAGISPDGNARMFTTPSDAGQMQGFVNNTNPETNIDRCVSTQSYCITGESNTNDLATRSYPVYTAARYCRNLVAHGKSDWYLPARNELGVLFNNRTAIGGFVTSSGGFDRIYWSSSERESEGYIIHTDFTRSSLLFSNSSGDNNFNVRCVRK